MQGFPRYSKISEKSDVDKLIIYRIKLRGITLSHFYLRRDAMTHSWQAAWI